MKWFIRLVLPLSLSATSLHSVPSSLIGRWKIGVPFEDMAPQPVGLSTRQLNMLIGQLVTVDDSSINACGKRIPFKFVSEEAFSAESFLERYGISPAHIGLESPVTELSFNVPPPRTVCGNSEGFSLLTDGHHAALEDGNAYFVLSRPKLGRH